MHIINSNAVQVVCPTCTKYFGHKIFAIYIAFILLTAYNVPDLEKKPTATVSRPLRGHLSRVTTLNREIRIYGELNICTRCGTSSLGIL